MPSESEQKALFQIKGFLEAGHSLAAIREGGWAEWIDHLEAEGYDLRTGQLALRPPEETPLPGPMPARDEGAQDTAAAGTPLTADTRPLQEEIARRSSRGWQLISHVGTEAQMRKPKHFSFVWAFLWFLLLAVGLIVYLLWHWSKKEEVVYLRMVDGHLEIATRGGPFELVAKPIRAWWNFTMRHRGWNRVVAFGAPLLTILVVAGVILAAIAGSGDDEPGSLESSAPAGQVASVVATPVETSAENQGAIATNPSPTKPSLPELTSQECSYLTDVPNALGDASSAYFAIADLFEEAGSDPLILFSDVWRIDVATQFALLQIARDDVRKITPPDSLSGFHSQLVAALSKSVDATTLIANGIDNFDVDLIDQGATQFGDAAVDVSSLPERLNDFRAARSGTC